MPVYLQLDIDFKISDILIYRVFQKKRTVLQMIKFEPLAIEWC